MATLELPVYAQPRISLEAITAEDFETASVRSAAPSYGEDLPTPKATDPGGI
jgi:hypothetical protein